MIPQYTDWRVSKAEIHQAFVYFGEGGPLKNSLQKPLNQQDQNHSKRVGISSNAMGRELDKIFGGDTFSKKRRISGTTKNCFTFFHGLAQMRGAFAKYMGTSVHVLFPEDMEDLREEELAQMEEEMEGFTEVGIAAQETLLDKLLHP